MVLLMASPAALIIYLGQDNPMAAFGTTVALIAGLLIYASSEISLDN